MVARVDFYVLTATTPHARGDFACRLAEKAYKLGNSVLIVLANPTDAADLDAQLWTCRPDSFVPHRLLQPNETPAPQTDGVCLCTAPISSASFDLLINLAPDPVPDLERFGRLAEVVVQLEPVLHATRRLFGYYKGLQLPVQTHKL